MLLIEETCAKPRICSRVSSFVHKDGIHSQLAISINLNFMTLLTFTVVFTNIQQVKVFFFTEVIVRVNYYRINSFGTRILSQTSRGGHSPLNVCSKNSKVRKYLDPTAIPDLKHVVESPFVGV